MKVQEIVVFLCGLLRGEGGGGKTLTAKIHEAGILLTSPDNMRESLEKLFDIGYFLAKKRQPYSDFSELISLQKMHEVKFSVSYNNKACTKFIRFISKSVFEESIKSKIMQIDFIAVLCDESINSAVVEKESIYILFVDQDWFQPTLSFPCLKDL